MVFHNNKKSNSGEKQTVVPFINGVPGTFYGRLFPLNSIHFVHSSYSLQWLSQVPEGVEEDNVGNIYMASSSPRSVLDAYYGQFQSDFSLFLRCRAQELVTGGRMVLTFLGRKSEEPSSKECCFIWELMSMALNQMASEGLVDYDKLAKFNIPQYTPSPAEVEAEVKKEGSFIVNRLAVTKVRWDGYDEDDAQKDGGYTVAACMRAVAEPLLVSQFGEGEVIDEVFRRYRAIVSERMANEKTEFVNVTVSLTKDA
ncbi:Salicylate carboxymethyltransferase [Linum grandiflorum]